MPNKQNVSQSIGRIGRRIHSTLEFDEIMERMTAEAAQAVGSETAAISLRQDDPAPGTDHRPVHVRGTGVAQRMHDAGAEVYLPKTGPSEGLLAAICGQG